MAAFNFLRRMASWVLLMAMSGFTVYCQDNSTENEASCLEIGLQCLNDGTCFLDGNTTTCTCSRFFTSRDCSVLDLRVPMKSVHEHGIVFEWSKEIYLENYWSIYARRPVSTKSNIRLREIPSNWTSETEVDGMKSDANEYVLCITHVKDLGNISSLNRRHLVNDVLNASLPNCGIVVTAYADDGAFSLAFIGIASAMGAVILVLLVIQTVDTCKNQQLRDNILKDVMGTLHRLRHPSRKKDDEEDDGDRKEKDGVPAVKEYGSGNNAGFSSRVSGPHSDPSIRV